MTSETLTKTYRVAAGKGLAVSLMTTATIERSAPSGISSDFQLMLDDLDERVGAFEMSEQYFRGLTGDEWLALTETAARNDIPLRFV